jgi:flagellar P-ring protein precursor FlgI
VATTIAGAINGEFVLDGYPDVAYVEDAKNVKVKLPKADLARPAQFIAAMMTIPIDPSMIRTEARIVVNENRGIILVTGDVMVGPVAITHEGLSITSITPEPQPTPDEPQVEEKRWAQLDTTNTRGRTATRLDRLLQAFDQLNVSVSDQIAIIHELKKTGALHAEIVTE